MHAKDQINRFSFDQLDVRGELVYLDDSWRDVLARHEYPPAVRRQLGEAMAIVTLLSVTIKFEGTLILQIQGSGPLNSLVAQITSKGELRALARWQDKVPDDGLDAVFGKGHIAITVIKRGGDRYQSLVALEGASLAEAFRAYFAQSEQLPTGFHLVVTADRVAGLLLQALPEKHGSKAQREEDFQRLNMLAQTLQADELLELAPQEILHRLFHEETVRLYSPQPVRFLCSCSRGKVANTLISLGADEMNSIIEEQGSIQVDCEFCNASYRFDAADVAQLTSTGAGTDPDPDDTLH